MKNRSLKASLQFAISVLVLVIGLVISQIVTQQYSNALLDSTKAKAENIAHKIAIDCVSLIQQKDLTALQDELDRQLLSNSSISYLFIETNEQVLAYAGQDIPDNYIGTTKPLMKDKGHFKIVISEKDEHFLDVAWPVFENRAEILRLGVSQTPIRQEVKKLWLQMNLMTALIILAAFVIIHYMISYFTKPLSNLTRQVENIDQENLDTQVEMKGSQEVLKLTQAFNSLLKRLQENTEQLHTSNQTLTEKHEALSRAHRQLNSMFAISKEIAGLPSIQDICSYLLKTFRHILTCQQMVFLICSPKQRLLLYTDNNHREYGSAEFDDIYDTLRDLQTYRFFKPALFETIKLPPSLANSSRLGVFPLRDHEMLMGALIVGCCDQCVCKTEELTVIDPILGQSASAVKRALAFEKELGKLNSTIEQSNEFCGMVGKDPKMQMVFKLIENVATTEASVLIQGESGTGKELIARAIHNCSPRKDNPFVIINCSAYPTTLLESELFGHVKGAFTGAMRRKAGRFEQADGGTVFLDEIGEISQSAQIKLLRVLQSHKFELLGGEETLAVDVRVLAATNKDLSQAVQAGAFREDLYYRLNVIPLNMPPLRERRNDIILLAKYFLKRFASEQKKEIYDFSSQAMHYLIDYYWPGNVRELENTIEHAVVLANGNSINVLDLPPTVTANALNNKQVKPKSLSQTEEQVIRSILQECGWNKSQAAEKIGISRGTLYQKIKKYNIVSN